MQKISELIEKLEKIKEKEGDAFVYCDSFGRMIKLDKYELDTELTKKGEKVIFLF